MVTSLLYIRSDQFACRKFDCKFVYYHGKGTGEGGFARLLAGRTDSFAFSFPDRNENKGVAAVETGGKQQSTGQLHLIVRILTSTQNKTANTIRC